MLLLLVLLILLLLFAGAGFTLHILWWVCIALLIIMVVSFAMRR